MKILVIALSGIGDALMFTPALEILHRKFPSAQIDALVMYKGVVDIYSRLPQIDKIHFHDYLNSSKLKSLLFTLSLRKKYDVSINVYPSNRKEYNIINLLIGAKKRCAVRYLRQDTLNLGFLNNVAIKENDSLHNVEENSLLVKELAGSDITQIPDLAFPLKETEIKNATDFFEANKLNNSFVIGFHPGCAILKNHIKRRWEPEKFIELGKKLIGNNNAKVLIFGGPDEDELKQRIFTGINSPNAFMVKTSSLADTAALMAKCTLFVTNDSSLMHVAAAMKLRTVAVIGPTNTNYIHPWHTEYKIASLNLECAPCFNYSPTPLNCSRKDIQFKCIKELGVDDVYKKILEFNF